MRSLVPTLKKSHFCARWSTVSAALGVSMMMPSGVFRSWAFPSRASSAHTSSHSSCTSAISVTPEMSGNVIRRGPTAAARNSARSWVRKMSRPGERKANRTDTEGGVRPAGSFDPGGELVSAQIQGAKRGRATGERANDRHGVAILLLLVRKVAAVEVEKLGPEQADRLRPGIQRCGDLGQTLDVGGQVYLGAVGGRRRQRSQGPQVLPVRARGRGQALVILPGTGIGIEDDLPSSPVDDQGVSGRDPR